MSHLLRNGRLGGILTALGVTCLIAAAICPPEGWLLYAAFLAIAVEGHRAALCSAAALGVALLLLPNKIAYCPTPAFGLVRMLARRVFRPERVFERCCSCSAYRGVPVRGFCWPGVRHRPAELFPLVTPFSGLL